MLTEKLQDLIRDHPGLIIAFFIAASITAAVPAGRVVMDSAVEYLMMAGDPDRVRNREIKGEFSNDEVLVVALDLGRQFDAGDLRGLRALSKRISTIDGVEEVFDLSTIEDVRGDGNAIDASPLVDFETVPGELARVRQRVQQQRFYPLS